MMEEWVGRNIYPFKRLSIPTGLTSKTKRKMQKCHVLTSQYSDKSGFKVIRVYMNEELSQAKKDLDMLKDHGDQGKEYSLTETELYQNNL